MTYKTLMAHLVLGRPNAGVLRIAGDLATRFDAAVVGVAACQPIQVLYADGYVTGAFIDAEREEDDKERKAAEAEFRAAFQARGATIQWRAETTLGTIADYVAGEARSADLIITGVGSDHGSDRSRRVDMGDLIMLAGRPVLIVPDDAAAIGLERVLVAWKDTPEARRAVFSALPILKKAAHVCIVAVAPRCAGASNRRRRMAFAPWRERGDDGVAIGRRRRKPAGCDRDRTRRRDYRRRRLRAQPDARMGARRRHA
jgi:hypothetical protein